MNADRPRLQGAADGGRRRRDAAVDHAARARSSAPTRSSTRCAPRGANLGVTSGAQAVDAALEPLESRGIIVVERGRVRVRDRNVLRYYARSLDHLLDSPSAPDPLAPAMHDGSHVLLARTQRHAETAGVAVRHGAQRLRAAVHRRRNRRGSHRRARALQARGMRSRSTTSAKASTPRRRPRPPRGNTCGSSRRSSPRASSATSR